MKQVWRILLGGLLMTAVIASMIGERVMILAQGREIVVAVEPVDPRDLFRGDYVRLSYGITRISREQVQDSGGHTQDSVRDEPIYVVLKPQDGRYVLDFASLAKPEIADDRVVLKGRWSGYASQEFFFVRYGVERYFVPQGHGRHIEKAVGEKRADVVLAVTGDGTAAIKTLRIDGEDVYREGLL
jgi:uncharacterized membrane-anchored protein